MYVHTCVEGVPGKCAALPLGLQEYENDAIAVMPLIAF
jgi:hypothetical protein